ncbi:MAG: hypothetical protein C0501_13215 [Isosphaera sp.]|nr:hypothetical protein [Isosphaera sp.]
MRRPRPLTGSVLLLCGLSAALAAGQDPDDPPAKVKRQPIVKKGKAAPEPPALKLSDEEALRKTGLDPADGPKLLAYLKQRTPDVVDQGRIVETIKAFGADDFDDRERATAEVERYGAAAAALLKKAEKDPDPEVAYRARLALRRMEKVPHAVATTAAVRAVARLKPDGAAAALVAYLPLADSEAVADTIREALAALAVSGGKAEPALVAALTDPSPLRRAAAAVALTEGGDPGERVRIKDAYPKVREAVLAEADPEAKFAGLWSLTLTTREAEYLGELVRLLPKLGRGRLWQVEDLLLQLAGTHPDGGRFGKTPEAVGKACDAWLGWWKAKGAKADAELAGLKYVARMRGLTDIVEMDNRGTNQARVVGLGPDLKERWRISGLSIPTDVKAAPNGNLWVVESGQNRVTERDPAGTILTTRMVYNQPVNLDFLPDGGMLVFCRSQVVRFDKTGNQVWAAQRQNYDLIAGRHLPNGEAVFLTNYNRAPGQPVPAGLVPQNLFRLDDKGVEVKGADPKNPVLIGYVFMPQWLGLVGDDRILVCERDMTNRAQPVDQVAEYEVKTGKQVWKHVCPQGSGPTSAQRLVNGNTLICLMNQNRLVEVDPFGAEVWEYQAKDGLQVGRGYRR